MSNSCRGAAGDAGRLAGSTTSPGSVVMLSSVTNWFWRNSWLPLKTSRLDWKPEPRRGIAGPVS